MGKRSDFEDKAGENPMKRAVEEAVLLLKIEFEICEEIYYNIPCIGICKRS